MMRLEEKEIKRRANNVAESLKAFANGERGLTLAEVKPLINDLQGFYDDLSASTMGKLRTHFNADLSPLECKVLLSELKENKLIDPNTNLNAFWYVVTGDESAKPYSKPIVWLQSVRMLSYLIHILFSHTDKLNIWVKTERCFILKDGSHPKANTLCNGLTRFTYNENRKREILLDNIKEKFFPSIPNKKQRKL